MRRLVLLLTVTLLAGPTAPASLAAIAKAGKYDVTLITAPSPPVSGANRFLMTITESGKPTSGLGVAVHVDMVNMPMPADFTARAGSSAGRYVADVNLSMAGEWVATVTVRQMPGMEMAGDGKAEFLVQTGGAVTARQGGRGRWLLLALALVVVVVLLFLAFRSRGPARGIAAGLLTILVVFAVTAFVVRTHRDPTVSTILGSARMDMEAMQPPTGAAAVSVEVARFAPFQETVSYTGAVVPDVEEDIYPRVMGKVAYLPLYPGDRVRAGQVVARLDAQELSASARAAAGGARAAESDLQTARQDAQEAERAIGAARAGVGQARGEVESARAEVVYWKQEIAREQHLYGVGAISKEELDRETSQAATADAKLAQANAGVRRAQQEVAQAEARRAAAGAAVASARAKVTQARALHVQAATMQGYTELRTMQNGVVTARNVVSGVVVQPGDSLLKIAKTDYVRLQANVAQADLAGIRVGQRLLARDGNGRTIAAPVTAIFPVQDPSTRTAVVEARVPNPEDALKPGGYLTVQLPLGAHADRVISVPNHALLPRADQTSLFVVKHEAAGTVARRVRVVTGKTGNARTEILSGLHPGDEVIVSGAADLNDGDAVTVVTAPTGS